MLRFYSLALSLLILTFSEANATSPVEYTCADGTLGFSKAHCDAKDPRIPILRPGSLICDLDPETDLRMVYLPKITLRTVERVTNNDASTELMFEPAIFDTDGQLSRPITTWERVVPHESRSEVRYIVIAPAKTLYIERDGKLPASKDNELSEQALFELVNTQPDFQYNAFSQTKTWDAVFAEYLEQQRRIQTYQGESSSVNGEYVTIPSVISPIIRSGAYLSSLKAPDDAAVSILIEPAVIEFQSEAEVVEQWEAYAERVSKESITLYECNGPVVTANGIPKVEGPPPMKTFDDIGIKISRYVSGIKIRKYNINGKELE